MTSRENQEQQSEIILTARPESPGTPGVPACPLLPCEVKKGRKKFVYNEYLESSEQNKKFFLLIFPLLGKDM